MNVARGVLKEVVYCNNPYEAAEGADAIILFTEWNQLRNLELDKIKKLMTKPVFIDLRNVYNPAKMKEMGFIYVGVGR